MKTDTVDIIRSPQKSNTSHEKMASFSTYTSDLGVSEEI